MLVVFQTIEYGALVSSAPSAAPSSRSWTPATPTLSDAVADTVTLLPDTVAPLAGAVIDAVGGVVSAAPNSSAPMSCAGPIGRVWPSQSSVTFANATP
jgi:hypothetical protein